MPTAIEMQQLAEAGPRLAAPPMAPARLMFGHQAGALQGLFHEGVAEAHAVLAARELVEVADVEALVAVPIQRKQPLNLGDGARLGDGR